jgi:6-phosphogluconolactonase
MTASRYLIFTGSYEPAGQPGLRAFVFDSDTGAFSQQGEYDGVAAPSYLALHPNGHWLYAVSETSRHADGVSGHVHALACERSRDTVTFSLLNVQPSGGDWPCHLRFDPSANWLLVSNYGMGSVSVLPVRADGSLGEMSALMQHRHGSGAVPDRQEGPHAHSSIFTPDGMYAIVADLGDDLLVLYHFKNGQLTKAAEMHTAAGAGPRHMGFHPNGRILYVTNELNGTLNAYDYRPGRLDLRETCSTLPENPPENLVADLHLSPAGDRLYVSNRGHNSLVSFAVTGAGALERLALSDCGGNWPRNFAISPDGRFILVANQYSGEIVCLPLRPEQGEIGAPVARLAIPKAACVVFAMEM